MKERRKKIPGVIKIYIRIMAVLFVIALSALIFINGYRLEEISVEGLSYYTEEEFISKIAGNAARKNTILFRLQDSFEGKKTIPYIQSYDITAKGKNTIHIQVYEKILVGCVKVMGQYLYFDKDGYVTESSSEWLSTVPLVKGLEFDRILLYEKLEIQKDELYTIILNITKLVREYAIPVQTISFNSRGEVELEVGALTVALGKRAAYDMPIQKLADILPTVEGRKLLIDLSRYNGGSEDIIAKPKEE
ncbi:MAG: FtsQ-type POTRA domain-containing protein [Lachnospiraceae bacterium]|nr:FtsQ-type POTRA domain-containing protein [Lachnospiraceae bacterium]